jgi:hypothetical protein
MSHGIVRNLFFLYICINKIQENKFLTMPFDTQSVITFTRISCTHMCNNIHQDQGDM